MFEADFTGVTDYLDEVQRALEAANGDLGQVKINDVTNPQDVERALAQVEEIVDRALAPHVANPTVREMAEQMKAGYKQRMLQQVEAKKAQIGSSQLSSEG